MSGIILVFSILAILGLIFLGSFSFIGLNNITKRKNNQQGGNRSNNHTKHKSNFFEKKYHNKQNSANQRTGFVNLSKKENKPEKEPMKQRINQFGQHDDEKIKQGKERRESELVKLAKEKAEREEFQKEQAEKSKINKF